MKIIVLIIYCVVNLHDTVSHHYADSEDDCTDSEDSASNEPSRDLHPANQYAINEIFANKIHKRFPAPDTEYRGLISEGFKNTENTGSLSFGSFRYPFAVAILKRHMFYANGVLIDRRWVLTSAREFHGKRPKQFLARLGSLNSKRGGTLVKIKKLLLFPLYVFNEPNYDIALLKLKSPVDISRDVQPISWTNNDLSIFLTLYWPKINNHGKYIPKTAPERINHHHLRVATQTSIFKEECHKRLLRDNLALERTMLCFTPIQALHSPCVADPGAPVLSFTGLMGITSGWVSPRCRLHPLETPIIVTRISSPMIRSWMREVILKKTKYRAPVKKVKHAKHRVQHHIFHPAVKKQHQFKKLLTHELDHKHIDGMM